MRALAHLGPHKYQTLRVLISMSARKSLMFASAPDASLNVQARLVLLYGEFDRFL